MAIGHLIMAFAHVSNIYIALGFLSLIGVTGGFYVVPLNALLQERGHETVGAGNAVAVQNFFENCTMLTLVGLYVVMQKNGLPVIQTATIFGAVIFISISLFALARALKK